MSYLRDRAIILRTEPFREQDVWLTCYGRMSGKFTAVARGSRVLHAKHLGHLQPLSEVEVMVAKGVTFDKVAVARLIAPRHHVRASLSATVLAGAAANLVDQLTQPGAPDLYLYELLQEALDIFFETEEEVTPVRGQFLFAAFALKLLRMLGHVPLTDRCHACQALLKDESFLLEKMGVVVCSSCRFDRLRSEEGIRLPPHAIRLFAFVGFQPLQECLKLTASGEVLDSVQAMAMASLRQASIYALPHGFQTVRAMLMT